ncbi:MAG: O-sialoglycoprotein endopeptidase [Acidaminococcaceae bacterium]|nr:O-sialoglycoprotein endopeptidase [Acidaminococcaceae bacterium]
MTEVYLGIDTSCYTTSLFFMDRQGNKVAEARRILKVKLGGCGLQQSEMLYQHTRNLPELMEEAVQGHSFSLLGIGVSAKPRPREDSYMPAFLAGLSFARSLAALHHIPLWQISHQENHLEAAAWSAKGPDADRFLFLHASGGTTDLLLAEKNVSEAAATEKKIKDNAVAEKKSDVAAIATEKSNLVSNYTLQEIGCSLDLHAGQFVDRVGVALGLGFPAGPALERLASQHTEIIEIPVSVHKTEVSFSGPCTWVLRKIEQCLTAKTDFDADNCTEAEHLSSTEILQSTAALQTKTAMPQNDFAANIAAGVQWGLAETFVRMIRNAAAEYNCREVLLAGGVASNQWIRNQIIEKLAKRQTRVWLPEAKYSGDNAAGCAAYARRQSES